MELLTNKLTLSRFLYLLSFDTKMLAVMNKEEKEELLKDYKLIHTYFISREGKKYTKLFKSACVGKASSLNGAILKKM